MLCGGQENTANEAGNAFRRRLSRMKGAATTARRARDSRGTRRGTGRRGTGAGRGAWAPSTGHSRCPPTRAVGDAREPAMMVLGKGKEEGGGETRGQLPAPGKGQRRNGAGPGVWLIRVAVAAPGLRVSGPPSPLVLNLAGPPPSPPPRRGVTRSWGRRRSGPVGPAEPHDGGPRLACRARAGRAPPSLPRLGPAPRYERSLVWFTNANARGRRRRRGGRRG